MCAWGRYREKLLAGFEDGANPASDHDSNRGGSTADKGEVSVLGAPGTQLRHVDGSLRAASAIPQSVRDRVLNRSLHSSNGNQRLPLVRPYTELH